MSSRYASAGGSRYPSAYGHTPSYRSYVKGDIGVDAAYPSALGEKKEKFFLEVVPPLTGARWQELASGNLVLAHFIWRTLNFLIRTP